MIHHFEMSGKGNPEDVSDRPSIPEAASGRMTEGGLCFRQFRSMAGPGTVLSYGFFLIPRVGV